MKKWILLVVMALALCLVLPAAFAADSPVQPIPQDKKYTVTGTVKFIPTGDVTPLAGVDSTVLGLTVDTACPIIYADTTTGERVLSGLEIRLFDVNDVDETGELQGVVPSGEVTYLEYAEIAALPAEDQAKFTEAYSKALNKASSENTTLTNFFWLDIPDQYEEILRIKDAYTNDNGQNVIDGEYLELNITKPGTNISCTVNGKDMDVIDNKDGTVTLKLTETGAVAVFAEEPTSDALNLSIESSVADVHPDPYVMMLNDKIPAIGIYDMVDEQKSAVSTKDVTLYPVEYISKLDPDDQAVFLQNYENVRDNSTDQVLRNFFWLDIPEYYESMLSADVANGRYLRLVIDIPGENPRVTVNGQEMELELIEGSVYAVKLTCTGAVAVYSDPVE